MDTEKLATSAVVDSISLTDILSAFINEGDKEPSFDGSIYIHADARKTKEGIKKVPVQIKGTKRKKNLPKGSLKYTVSRIDLDNWLNHGGIVLFVVFIDNTGTQKSIFYCSLLPVKIQSILRTSHGKKNVSVQLKAFPADNDKKVGVMLDFYDNMQKQASFANAVLYSLEELEKKGVLEGVTFSVTTYGKQQSKFDMESLLFQNDVYMYANTKGSPIPLPLPEIPQHLHISRTEEGDVQVKDRVYYRSYRVIRSADETNILVGRSLTLKIAGDLKSAKLDYKRQGTLSDCILDTACLIDVFENKELTVNGATFGFAEIDDTIIQGLSKSLEYFRDVKKMLELLGVKQDLNCDCLTDQDVINIRNFTNAMVYGRPINFPECEGDRVIGQFKLGNLVPLIWANRVATNEYKLTSFFDDHPIVAFESEDKKKHPYPVSHYILLKKENFLEAANIDYKKIVDDIPTNNTSPFVTEQLTLFMLEMLKAYDAQTQKDSELLSTAEQYCDWLIESAGCRTDMMTLNRLQIIRRKREFLSDEISCLQTLRKSNQDAGIRCAANLLLGKNDVAQDCFDELDDEIKKIFIEYPICHFGNLSLQGTC